MNEPLVQMLKRHEGCHKNNNGRHVLYKSPANKWSCGYGRNCEDTGFSEDEVELMLKNDIRYSVDVLKLIFPNFDNFSMNRRNALVNMLFTLGSAKFLLFRKMIIAIKKDDWEEAAKEMTDIKGHILVGIRALEVEDLLMQG